MIDRIVITHWHGLVRRAWTRFWDGPPDLACDLKRQWRLVAIRWPVIVFVACGLPLAHLAPQPPLTAYAVLIVAVVYNAAVTLVFGVGRG